jgi:toxin-antitoxin system PIN domain toxin
MSDELAVVDTNVLVYAHCEGAEHHDACRALLDRTQEGHVSLCVVPQILAEFFAVITDPRRVTTAYQSAEALDAIERILGMPGMTLVSTPLDLVDRWRSLVRQYPVTGGDVFDAQLVATMQAHDVRRIFTFDRANFKRYAEIEVLTP